jgi:hypothetical protein
VEAAAEARTSFMIFWTVAAGRWVSWWEDMVGCLGVESGRILRGL